jgi:lipopolysaccharide biosynthesis protein
LIDGTGYICILSGIDDVENLPRLREEAITQRALVRFGLDDDSVPDHKLFDDPFRILPLADGQWRPVLSKRGNIAVVLHLYYAELWPEFELFLNQMQGPFDLRITHCGLGDQIREQIVRIFSHATLTEVENRGRDIWPFLSLLNAGSLDGYDYICKIHSKKSAHGSGIGESLLGSRWRRRALYDLLAFGRAETILDMFERDPRLGLVGPKVLRVPNARVNVDVAWGSIKNRDNARQLALRMAKEVRDEALDYFAGSMFWIKRDALTPIRGLNLKREDFPEESGQLDGEIQHTIERLFSVCAQKAGFKIADMSPIDNFPIKKTLSI